MGLIPGLLGEVPLLPPWPLELPDVNGLELDEPELGVEPGVPLLAPGNVPQGEPLGEPPGLFGGLGFTVDGCVVLPGVGLAGEFDPGTVPFGVPFGVVDPGVVCCVVLPPGGVTGEPGVEVFPVLPALPAGGTPPEGAACATAQLAQHNTTKSNPSFDFVMMF